MSEDIVGEALSPVRGQVVIAMKFGVEITPSGERRGLIGGLSFTLSRANVQEIDDGFAKLKIDGKRAPDALLATHDDGANLGTSSKGGYGRSPLPAKSKLR